MNLHVILGDNLILPTSFFKVPDDLEWRNKNKNKNPCPVKHYSEYIEQTVPVDRPRSSIE